MNEEKLSKNFHDFFSLICDDTKMCKNKIQFWGSKKKNRYLYIYFIWQFIWQTYCKEGVRDEKLGSPGG